MVKPFDATSIETQPETIPLEPLPPAVETWLNTPVMLHLARWKREIAEGLRDADGRWIVEPSRRAHHATNNATH